MFVLESYSIAVVFCVVTMLCWGSWANTQKLAGKTWRFELFYWDYVFGVMLMSLVFAFTLGSMGEQGRGFLKDFSLADWDNLGSALLGGVVFNAANILLVAAIAIAGMSVAFPVGIGLALVLGVLINYANQQTGNLIVLLAGIASIAVAIVLDAMAYRRLPDTKSSGGVKGLILSVLCGVLMSLFYFLVARSMADVQITAGVLAPLTPGKLTPYTAMVLFSLGILGSNFVINTLIMIKPFQGDSVPISEYFQGTPRDHFWGVLGGCIWAVGMTLSIIAAGQAGFAISYGLGQGATMVAAFWGVFVWHEFRDAPPGTNLLITLMFAGYFIGLVLVIIARIL